MRRVKNLRTDDVEIAATGQVVPAGGVVDVDDDLGLSLCEQVDAWAADTTKKSAKGAE